MTKRDDVDAAIARAAAEAPGEKFQTWSATVELPPAADGGPREAILVVPQDLTPLGYVRLVKSLTELLNMADALRAQAAQAGLVVPTRPKLVLPT